MRRAIGRHIGAPAMVPGSDGRCILSSSAFSCAGMTVVERVETLWPSCVARTRSSRAAGCDLDWSFVAGLGGRRSAQTWALSGLLPQIIAPQVIGDISRPAKCHQPANLHKSKRDKGPRSKGQGGPVPDGVLEVGRHLSAEEFELLLSAGPFRFEAGP